MKPPVWIQMPTASMSKTMPTNSTISMKITPRKINVKMNAMLCS